MGKYFREVINHYSSQNTYIFFKQWLRLAAQEVMCVCVYTHTHTHTHVYYNFLDGASCKEPACQCRRCNRHGFDSWVGKIHWMRTWQPTLIFLPGESHEERSLAGYSPYGCSAGHDRSASAFTLLLLFFTTGCRHKHRFGEFLL